MAKSIQFDPDDLTFGEICDFEDIAGVGLTQLQQGAATSRMLLAMVYISERRANPAFTIEDAKRMKLSEVDFASSNPTELAPLEQPAPIRRKRAS